MPLRSLGSGQVTSLLSPLPRGLTLQSAVFQKQTAACPSRPFVSPQLETEFKFLYALRGPRGSFFTTCDQLTAWPSSRALKLRSRLWAFVHPPARVPGLRSPHKFPSLWGHLTSTCVPSPDPTPRTLRRHLTPRCTPHSVT
jgi:hypothetical protein